MQMPKALLEADTLSEVLKGRDPQIDANARKYLAQHGRFTISVIFRYEILKGLKAKRAIKQIQNFINFCEQSLVLRLTDQAIEIATDVYTDLHARGQLIGDADILIAGIALANQLPVVTIELCLNKGANSCIMDHVKVK